jgi:hypothetical protein
MEQSSSIRTLDQPATRCRDDSSPVASLSGRISRARRRLSFSISRWPSVPSGPVTTHQTSFVPSCRRNATVQPATATPPRESPSRSRATRSSSFTESESYVCRAGATHIDTCSSGHVPSDPRDYATTPARRAEPQATAHRSRRRTASRHFHSLSTQRQSDPSEREPTHPQPTPSPSWVSPEVPKTLERESSAQDRVHCPERSGRATRQLSSRCVENVNRAR